MAYCEVTPRIVRGQRFDLTIALAGNANVGKSVIFNALTGMNQIIGNWPGKTVELAEGSFDYKGKHIRVVDLPGIYSLSTYSQEEVVSREFIAEAQPDVVVNVVDSTVLERNLYFTLQLRELGAPLVTALNLIDLATKEGLVIDESKLASLLGVPVVRTSGASGKGLDALVDACLATADRPPVAPVAYGKEVEGAIRALETELGGVTLPDSLVHYAPRFLAIKLLEGDAEIMGRWGGSNSVTEVAAGLAHDLEQIHGESGASIMSSERYSACARIAAASVRRPERRDDAPGDRLDKVLLHRVFGWVTLVIVMFAVFGLIFVLGGRLSSVLDALFGSLQNAFLALPIVPWLRDFLWGGVLQGVLAGVSIALPYIVPFYIVLSFLENSGYMARMAFLTDAIMHRMGLHGKAFMPIILGFGCNVPAVLGTRIMERDRDRFIGGVLASLVPCSARTVVILGLVGAFMGFWPALSLYLISLVIIFVVGRLLNRFIPGTNPGLIMEMPSLKWPPLRITLKQTWFRLKDFVVFAFPIIAGGSVVLYVFGKLGWVTAFATWAAPFTEGILGLPPAALVVLVFGILRKELALIMLATLMHTPHLGTVMTPQQMYIFALIVMLYVPCVSTIAALRREFGTRRATLVSVGEVVLALVLGALVNWGWNLVSLIH
ncbi:MAG: ferrous iron transport protein B [Coprothermobacter sp.]|jgi:ferrous iron transport protein B|nr:ferrous iron transport protein B [Coprothermobacter sp.]